MKREILYFNEFNALNEAKSSKPKTKLILLSNLSEESYTIPAVLEECKKRGIECRANRLDGCLPRCDEVGKI
jgi:hypothetical protein